MSLAKQNIITIDYGNTSPTVSVFNFKGELLSIQLYCEWLLQNKSNNEQLPNKVIISDVGSIDRTYIETLFANKPIYVETFKEEESFLDMPVNYSKTIGDDRIVQDYCLYKNCDKFLKQNNKYFQILIDSGTFTTIDLLSGNGLLGGWIFPGPQTYLNSFQRGAKLTPLKFENNFFNLIMNNQPLLGHKTESAINNSLAILILGELEFSLREALDFYDLNEGEIILTGGFGLDLVAPYSKYLDEKYSKTKDNKITLKYKKNLIHEALYFLFKEVTEVTKASKD